MAKERNHSQILCKSSYSFFSYFFLQNCACHKRFPRMRMNEKRLKALGSNQKSNTYGEMTCEFKAPDTLFTFNTRGKCNSRARTHARAWMHADTRANVRRRLYALRRCQRASFQLGKTFYGC